MTWNYRIVKTVYGHLAIHEVFYSDDGSIKGWSEGESIVNGDDVDELKRALQKMHEAFDKPILVEVESNDPHQLNFLKEEV